nr:iron chelate uptake ABC transporter family permease subunit [Actinomyces sp.]
MTPTTSRSSSAFPTVAARRRWWLLYLTVTAVALIASAGLLAWNSPMPVGTRGFWLIAQHRAWSVLAMIVVAVCQSTATIAFQTVTTNRVMTPSIMGFESLYRTIHTSTVFFLGAAGLNAARTTTTFAGQLALMVGLCLLLYSLLLTSKNASMNAMLLIGVVLGAGLGSVSTFMQRLLTPSEFDVLTARLFGSVNNADPEYYPITLPIMVTAALGLVVSSRWLNVLALGRQTATGLGVITGAYFLMNHVFSAQGVVSVIIETVGGLTFLVVVLRKGRP